MKKGLTIPLVLGGALIGGALFVSFNFAKSYDQQTTHPALTDEAVDFYNLNFPSNPLTEDDKKWLVKGAIEENAPPRWFNHFYDPVYNQGWLGYTSSKEWAYSSNLQKSFAESQVASFAAMASNDNLSPADYSYQRALYDYAIDDRKRAMTAMGHIMHLLEDANVPDHTRNDTHLPFEGTESPYEKAMAKWSPANLDIAGKIFTDGARPVLLSSLGDYFNKIAKYSNNYFFSEDTILNEKYLLPRKISEKAIEEEGIIYRFALGRDKNKELFPLFRMDPISHWRNLATSTKLTIDSSIVLNDYWSRLSKDFIPHGAGALKLFLGQAELVKREYTKNQQVVRGPGLFGGVLGLLGISGQNGAQLAFDPLVIDSILNVPGIPSVPIGTVNYSSVPIGTLTVPIGTLTPSLTSSPTPLAQLTLSPIPLPTPSPTASPTPSLTLSPSPLPVPTQETSQLKKSGRVVINEVAWAGTTASALDEWIELFNTENYDVNLTGWTLKSADNSPNIVLDGIIKAGGYFLIERTDDNTITTKKADMTASFGSGGLNNEGEVLTLSDADGKIVDVVGKLGEKWFAGEASQYISMERINALAAGDNVSNWRNFQTSFPTFDMDAKGNKINGTPGAQNSSITVTSSSGGGGGSSSSTPTPTPIPSPSPTPEPEPSGSRLVVINEIAWMGTATQSNDEWMELYNTSSKSMDISGWTLVAVDGTPSIRLASKSIEPFGFFLFERTADTTISDILADQIYTGALENNGETLELRDKGGVLQDRVDSASGWYTGDNATKSSMERINPEQSGNNSSNWAINNGVTRNGRDAAGNPVNGTPRARNSVYANRPPSAVSNLALDTVTSFFGSVRLTWSAPKDNDNLPRDLTYDLRYATRSFDIVTDWDNAAKVASSSLPAVAASGTPASASFQILDYNKSYYFALKTCDKEVCSGLSNQPEKYTIGPAISGLSETFIGPANPKILWTFKAASASFVNQPTIAADGTIFFGAPNDLTGVPRLYAVNQDGAKKWHCEPPFAGPYATPLTPTTSDDGAVYFGQFDPGSFVEALNSDGTLRWQYNVGDRVNGVAVDTEGNIFFTSESNVITKIGPSGEEKWRVFNSFTFGFTPIPASGGDIFLGANNNGQPEYYRFSGIDGSVIWQKRASESFAYSTFDPVHDKTSGKLYASATDYGFVFTLDPSTGTMTKDTFQRMARPTTKVAIFEDTLIVGVDFSAQNPASGSAVYGIDKATKSVLWTFPLVDLPPVDSRVNKQIVVDADGNLYFATQSGKVYSLDKDGQERWVLDLGAPAELYPVLGENAVFMGVGGAAGGKLLKIADY